MGVAASLNVTGSGAALPLPSGLPKTGQGGSLVLQASGSTVLDMAMDFPLMLIPTGPVNLSNLTIINMCSKPFHLPVR